MNSTKRISRKEATKLGYATFNECMHYIADIKEPKELITLVLHGGIILNVHIESSEKGSIITFKYNGTSNSAYINSLIHNDPSKSPDDYSQTYRRIRSKNNEYIIKPSKDMTRETTNVDWDGLADKKYDMVQTAEGSKQLTLSIKLPNGHFLTVAYSVDCLPNGKVHNAEKGTIDMRYHGLERTEILALEPDTNYEESNFQGDGIYEFIF
ncbi:hypothetical protein CN918_25340 [Priestia megaterium]|nr:hypothetical protein CN918_25340 [Priestia megaterium]